MQRLTLGSINPHPTTREAIQQLEENDGNFRNLLRVLINSGDKLLRKHFYICRGNASYKIVNRVNASECFSILADETINVSLCVRCVNNTESGYVIREDLVKFVPVYDHLGSALASMILTTLKNVGIKIRLFWAITGLSISNSSVITHSCVCSLCKPFSKFSFDSSLQSTTSLLF
ncbi:hypothetical protein PR048_018020 [Dryococelus australis]|uniref:DUF4371 domain-containing protein n=1 Tax=Dryococelus australis TaxID=614101 RepID=A0ABQ9HB78_9NEOP|nr:hypothetical protein PR048_018020 [Dryococelus australis]